MKQRILYGAIFGIIVISVFLCKLELVFIAFTCLLALIGSGELFELLASYNTNFKTSLPFYKSLPTLIISICVLFASLIISRYLPISYGIILLALIFSLFIIELFSKNSDPIFNLASFSFSIIYVAIPLICSVLIAYKSGTYKYMSIFSILILIWCSDSFQYFSGKFFGKHKLFERISPNKTIEGVIGGLILTILAAILLSYYINVYSRQDFIFIAVIVLLFGIIGDLVESMLKRKAGIKDSGNIIPGHGGVLDRFDSYLFILPFVTVFIYLK